MPQLPHVILIPGLLCDADLWAPQVKALNSLADFTIADSTKHDSVEAIAKDILSKAPPEFALGGLSMGGYVALEIMRQAPDRVVRLALFDTSARADTDEQKTRRRLLLTMAKSGQFKGVTPRLLPMLIHPDRLEDKALTDVVMNMAERMGRDVFRNQQTAILNRIDSRPFLKDIMCPTMVVGGRQDMLTPPEVVTEIAAEIPNADLAILADCGHLSTLERPRTVIELMRIWLSPGRAHFAKHMADAKAKHEEEAKKAKAKK